MQEDSIFTVVYTDLMQKKLEIIHEQCLISYQELVDILNAQDEEVVFVGDGIDVAGDYIKDNLKCRYSLVNLI